MINWSDFPSDSLLHLPASTRPSSVHISHISTRLPILFYFLFLFFLFSSVHISHISTQFPLYFPALNDLCSYVSKYYICISIWISSFPFTSMTKKWEEKKSILSLEPRWPWGPVCPAFFVSSFQWFFFVVFQFLTMVLPNILISPKIWRVFVWRIGSPSFSTLIYNIINNYHHHLMIIII